MKKVYQFKKSYGQFSTSLFYGEMDLKLKLAHKKTCILRFENGIDVQVGIITGSTPKTYYSGNRLYGKYLFIVPENVKVVETQYSGSSNEDAFNRNISSIKSYAYCAESFGFDFYEIVTTTDVNGQCAIEIPIKLKNFEFGGFADLDEDVFIKYAMPCNLYEIIPGFAHQTQGWSRNEGETHLHAVVKVGEVNTFIPFVSHLNDDIEYENVLTRYIKKIN